MSVLEKLESACTHVYLYNVTFRLNDVRTALDPCIPYTASPLYGEDIVTKRVCLADSIEHCISAIGSCNRDLYEGCCIVVRRVNTALLDKRILITPRQLYESGKVPDALENMEYWYTGRVYCERLVYKVTSFNYEHKINWTCIKPEQIKHILGAMGLDSIVRDLPTAEDIFNAATGILEKDDNYDLSDELYDEVIELDWARGISISNLGLQLCETT